MRISGPKVKKIKHLGENYRWKISSKFAVKLPRLDFKKIVCGQSNISLEIEDGREFVGELLIQHVLKGNICVYPIAWSKEVPINECAVKLAIDNALTFGWKPKKKTRYPFYVCDSINTIDLPTDKARTRLIRKVMNE